MTIFFFQEESAQVHSAVTQSSLVKNVLFVFSRFVR